jgi:hypothetical protein
MNTLQASIVLSSNIPRRAPISADFGLVCLWTAFGLVLTALVFTLGFSAEVEQVLAVIG